MCRIYSYADVVWPAGGSIQGNTVMTLDLKPYRRCLL
jgi:hypothetical protein